MIDDTEKGAQSFHNEQQRSSMEKSNAAAETGTNFEVEAWEPMQP